jgi:Domain of unknown function (DUF4105)
MLPIPATPTNHFHGKLPPVATAYAKLAVGLLTLLGSTNAIATAKMDLAESLSTDEQWLALGHYEESALSASGQRSAIKQADFFLSPVGRDSPHDELVATLEALGAPDIDLPDRHAVCRFPARATWLAQHYPAINNSLKSARCPELTEWTSSNRGTSLSLIFANGYFSNPASFFGHVLLKINRSEDDETGLLDTTFNYGAIVEGLSDPASYVIKGVTGGYDGGFSQIEHHFHDRTYSEIEQRDLWEYRLTLTQDEVDLVLLHAREIIGKRYTYWFFKKNCAYRLGELVEIIPGVRVIPKSRPWLIPQDLIREAAAQLRRGSPLVAEVRYHPSRKSRFYERFHSLNERQKSVFSRIVSEDSGESSLVAIDELEIPKQVAVLDAILDFERMNSSSEDTAAGRVSNRYAAAFARRIESPIMMADQKNAPVRPESPDIERPSAWTQIGWYGGGSPDSYFLRVRPAYFDELDSGRSHPQNSALIMGDTTIRMSQGETFLESFTLFGVHSVTTEATGLPGDERTLWRVQAGYIPRHTSCSGCSRASVQAAIGTGSALGASDFVGVFLGVGVGDHSRTKPTDHGYLGVFWSGKLTEYLSHYSEYRLMRTRDIQSFDHALDVKLRLRLGYRADLRVGAAWLRTQSKVHVGLGYYW